MADLMLIVGMEILLILILLILLDMFKNGKGGFSSKLFMAIGVALIVIATFEVYGELSISPAAVLVSSIALGVFFLILSALFSK